jgi:hypothetical protein
MKKRISILAAIVLLLTVVVSAGALAGQDIGILVNGRQAVLDAMPFIENDRTLIPLRGVLERMGAQVEWKEAEQAVEITAEGLAVLLTIGQDTATITRDGELEPRTEIVQLEVPARLVEDRTFIPVRFVAQALGAEVEWDDINRTVIIRTYDRDAVEYQVVSPQSIHGDEDLYLWYEANRKSKGFHVKSDDGGAYILIAAGEKRTGGYGIKIEGVYLEDTQTASVKAVVTSPAPDMMVTQAFTYPNVLIKLDMEGILNVKGGFVEDRNIKDGDVITGETGESLEEMGKAIPADRVVDMVMYSLTGEKIKTFSGNEVEDIIHSLNTGATYSGPHILMLAGNSIKVTMEGQSGLNLTSYGYKEHVLINGEVDGVSYAHCVVSPGVGAILLDTGSTE